MYALQLIVGLCGSAFLVTVTAAGCYFLYWGIWIMRGYVEEMKKFIKETYGR